MASVFKLAFLLVAVAAVVVGGWIGYRATARSSEVCFVAPEFATAIMCMDPANGEDTFRVVAYARDGNRVRTFPYRVA